MKKVLALVLASAMALGMTATAFAAKVDKNNGWDGTDGLIDGYNLGASGQKKSGHAHNVNAQTVSYDGNVVPADKIEDWINLDRNLFAGMASTTLRANLTAQEIRDSKMTVRQSVSAGSKAIDSISIDTKVGAIKVKYVTEYVSTKDLDFDFTVYLVIDGKRQDDQSITFVGTLANETTEVFDNDDYVDLQYGQIAHANDFISKIEVDLGNGVSIFTKFFKDKKYYGTATRDADEADDIVFTKYPDIDNVVTLKTVGLNSTGDIVKLDTDYSDYFVYDANLVYLGKSNEMLPYSTKYYLANKQLNVADDDDVDEGDEPSDEGDDGEAGNPDTGGDDGVANNANANPGTGR